MSVSGDEYLPCSGPGKGKGPAPIGQENKGKDARGRNFEKKSTGSKSHNFATEYLKLICKEFYQFRNDSLNLPDTNKIKAFEKQLEDLKGKLKHLQQNLTENEQSDMPPQMITDLEKLIESQLLDLKNKEDKDVEKNIPVIELKLSEMIILYNKSKIYRLYSTIADYYRKLQMSSEDTGPIYSRYDVLMKNLTRHIEKNLSDTDEVIPLLNIAEVEFFEEKSASFLSEFLSIKKVIAYIKLNPLQDNLNNLRARLTKAADNLSTEESKQRVIDLINRLPSSLTTQYDQLEIDQLNKAIKDLEDIMSQIENEVDNVIIRDIFETKYKDFIGAKKISRIKYEGLSHSYFVIREIKEEKVEFSIQQQFHKKLNENGFINAGAMMNVHKLKSLKTGDVHLVRSVVKKDKTLNPQATLAVQEFKDDPNLCGGHHLTYKSKKSGEVKRVFLHPYMDTDFTYFIIKGVRLDNKSKIASMLQICRGVKKMHDDGWIHKDIKPDNILVKRVGEKLIVKLADFGFTQKIDSDDQEITICGTKNYVATELARKKGIFGLEAGKNCDIYSLGMTFWAISENEMPNFNFFKNAGQFFYNPPQNFDKLFERGYPKPEEQTPMQRLIYQMINPEDPTIRPNIDNVIAELEKML